MERMKPYIRLLAVGMASGLLVVSGLGVTAYRAGAGSAEPIEHKVQQVRVNGNKLTVDMVAVDLSDPRIEVSAETAEGGIGSTEAFASMIDRTGAVAAVNGTFFEAFQEDIEYRTPYGLLYHAQDLFYNGDKDISITVGSDKKADIRRMQVSGSVQAGAVSFTLGGMNTPDPMRNDLFGYLYTKDYGDSVGFPGIKISADASGKITAITDGATEIPDGGQVLVVANRGANWDKISPIRIGDRLRSNSSIIDRSSGKQVPAQELQLAIGAGPKLVTGGYPDIDYQRDGFEDPLVTSKPNVRSFAGVDGSGRLVFGTLSYCTLDEAAEGLAELGLQEAMNLDGGASSAFYADGQVRRAAGRLLSNFLIVRKHELPQVQVSVNGEWVGGVHGFVKDNVTMVPFRALLNRLGASYSWDAATRTLTASKGSLSVSLHPGSAIAAVNGNDVSMEAEAVLSDGSLYVPLRFVSECFGAVVAWDKDLYRASLTRKK